MLWIPVTLAIDASSLATYFARARSYWSPETTTFACLEQQERDFPEFRGKMMTLGLEGAGHHVLFGLGKNGGVASFPRGGAFRKNESLHGDNPNVKAGKYLVIVRDPVDSFHSALRRFWRGSLDVEFRELNRSMFILSGVLRKIPCHLKLHVPFEWLVNFPEEAKGLLKYFLQDPDFEDWFQKSFTQKERTWPGPFPIRCNDSSRFNRRLTFYNFSSSQVDWLRHVAPCNGDHCYRNFRKQLATWLYHHSPYINEVAPRQPMTYCY